MRPVFGLVALIASLSSQMGCGDLLQEPDTGTRPAEVRLETIAGNDQIGSPGAALAQPVRVRLIGRDEQPLPRLRVEWSVVEGAGQVEPRNAFSDANGIAETTWILGPAVGVQKIRATVNQGLPMTFDATAVAP